MTDAAIGILEAKCALCHGPSKMSGLDVRDQKHSSEEACVVRQSCLGRRRKASSIGPLLTKVN